MSGKCVVDTNVPKVANLATQSGPESDVPDSCVAECVDAVLRVTENRGLVLDESGEIYQEYIGQLSLSGKPGVGDYFVKWVHDNLWTLSASQRVSITKNGDSYMEFPAHDGLVGFDRSDRKFVAVSNAHPDKPLILQATDSKWWGWKDALAECGIEVAFLCPDYVEGKYESKMGT